ncbi:MAG: hypothetical protein AUK27_00050 [Deltaproteobacteria bacterium CG2_30_66_27]|nr:MAG: hypothetical protein AUK27_00050 [Deltaproteobacteria bacterium CG2_30_66_27]PJB31276.1 MAG: hypothetical protein CO109_10835 [Deltaproteobacteria bacterium CG_4_9_14_3_um_filter_65_9]
MMTKKPVAWLALLLSCLMALPPVAMADDTELFTTSANPNVLLMLDTTGSMGIAAGGTPVGDLDGDGSNNSRMDILWKVVYTLLNSDLSIPSATPATITATLDRARRWASSTVDKNISKTRQYQYVQVTNLSGGTWSTLPASGTVQIGSLGTAEPMSYTSRSSGSPYRFYFSSAKSFIYNHSQGSTVSYTTSASYGSPNPTNHTEAMSSAFLNNLTTDDENLLKARLGLMTFTTNPWGTAIQINTRNPVSSTAPNAPPFSPSYQNIWSSVNTYAYASGGTPTAQALRAAQGFFDTAYDSSQACRQNFAVMVTDGEDTMGGLDGATGSGYGPMYYRNGSNYSYTYSAGYTFTSDGWSGSYWDGTPFNNGQVARHNAVIQEAANLASHSPSAKLFTIGVGVSDAQPALATLREVLRRAAEQTNDQADVSTYTTIGASGDNTARGAGRTFFATDAAELAVAMRNAFQQITAGMYSFTAPTVASVRMTDRNYLYKASFTPASPPATFWEGRLEALSINPDNTMTSHWEAGNVLKSTLPADRNIYTADNTWTRLGFTTAAITPEMLGVDNTAARDNVVNYIRGAGHDNNAKLGDIFHSKPIVVGPPSRFYFDEGYSTAVGGTGAVSFVEGSAHRKRVVYVGTNDGMLHAFVSGAYQTSGPNAGQYDTGTGAELFGYIPNYLLTNLEGHLPGEVTRHGYYVDSSPRVSDVWIDNNANGTKESSEWRTVLIGGMRKGGYGYFALDVTDPDAADYPKVLWEYSDPSHVAETWSEPSLGKVKVMSGSPAAARDRWVAIFGGGKSDDGVVGGSLVVLDIATGTPLKIFTTGIDNVIPASPTTVLDGNGYIKFAYVADLDGSLYKFDFRTPGTDNTYSEWTMNKIFQASAGQPVYHRVAAGSTVPAESTRYLFFGTGDQENPVTNTGNGKFYAIKDTDAFWPGAPLTEASLANLSTSITSLGGGTPTQYGWYASFASVPSTANDTNTHSGEKVLSDPVVFYNNVYFTTFTPDTANPCGGGGIARVYGLQMLNAGAGLASIASLGETTTTKVPYHVYTGSEGGIPSSPSLSIYPSGQSSIFVGFSTGSVKEIKIESPPQMKTIKSWKEMF